MTNRGDIQNVFETWLDLSADEEILILLDLVQDELRDRGHTVCLQVQSPSKEEQS